MKVRKACHMQSLTALLRQRNPKNSFDSNEERESWFNTVPSVTYIWTRKPQWRRRHKNRKKVKTIPVALINSGANEDKKTYFLETLRQQERTYSRSSTSPYETCSSRQILTETELVRKSCNQRNREVLMSMKKNHLANRKVLICETRSDSRLHTLRGTKSLGLSRSHKRVGVGTTANSQNTVGTLSSLEVNRSVQLLVCKALQSDNSIPKRRVTFSNYVSENSVTDTRSRISSIIMNDNEASENSWSRRSYVLLTDDEDNCSMQTDLSCLISSIIFDDSKSSFFSLTSGKSSEKYKKSNTDLDSELNGTFFYVNSSYSNGSSCNLLSLSKNFSSDNCKKSNGSSLIRENSNNTSDIRKTILSEQLSQSSLRFNEIVPLFRIAENFTTETTILLPTSCVGDDMKKGLEEKTKQSNLFDDIVPVFEKQGKAKTETMNSRNPRIIDFIEKKIDEKLSQVSLSNGIGSVFERPDDVTTNTEYKCTKRADNFMRHQWKENKLETHDMPPDIRIAEETKTEHTSSHASCGVDVMKNNLDNNLSQSNEEIPSNTPNDITTESMYDRTFFIVNAMKKQLEKKLNSTNYMDNLLRTPEDITTANLFGQTRLTNDFVKYKSTENEIESNEIASEIIKAKKNKTEHEYKVPKQSNSLNFINPPIRTSEDITTRLMYTRNPQQDDFLKNQRREYLIESNNKNVYTKKNYAYETKTEAKSNLSQSKMSDEIVHVVKETDDITEPIYFRTQCNDDFVENQWKDNWTESNRMIPDIEIPAEIQSDPKNESIECITIELKDISSTIKEIVIGSQIGSDNENFASMPKNDISTDTNDLIVVDLISSLEAKNQLVDNDPKNELLNVREIFNFLQQPSQTLDASLLFEELMTAGQEPLRNNDAIEEFDYIGDKKWENNEEKIVDQVKLFRIDADTCGEYESVFVELKDFCDDFKNNEILENKSSLKYDNCLQEPCRSLVRNLNESSKHLEFVESSTSHFSDEYAKCPNGSKCCLVCGRRKIDNPRYIRPLCRVKGGTWSPQSEKDPWMNVIKKVIKYDNRMELIPQTCMTPKNKESSKDAELAEELPKKSVSNTHQHTSNETPKDVEKISENIVINNEREDEFLRVIITEAEEPSLTIPLVGTNMPSSRVDQSTSCCPPEFRSSTSFGFATFRGLRTQSAKSYFMRESVRTVQGTANRLLCVISESDSLMAVPPFLPKKPPNWFFRQMPTRRCLRR